MNKLYDNNPKLLNDFLDYLQGILGYSDKTIKGYNLDLLESDVIAFLVYLNFHRDNNPNTRQRKLCAIRRFYKWLLSNNPGIIKENPTKKISNIQKIKRLPKYLIL